MRVYIGKRHIQRADEQRRLVGVVTRFSCPIAFALLDRPGVEVVIVSPRWVRFGTATRGSVYRPAPSAREFIRNYDAGYAVRPGYVHLSRKEDV